MTAPPTAPQTHHCVGVEVVLDVDLAVGAAADQDQSVDVDHVVRGELF